MIGLFIIKVPELLHLIFIPEVFSMGQKINSPSESLP